MTDGRAFEPEAFKALMLHDWPLNVRELLKVVDRGRGAEPRHPDHRLRAPAARPSRPGSSTTAQDELEDTNVDPAAARRDRRDETRRRAAWCVSPSPPPPTTRVRRPAPTREELVNASPSRNGQRRPGGAPPQSPVRRGLAEHPALRDRRGLIPQRTGASDGDCEGRVCGRGVRARSGSDIPGSTRTASARVEGEPGPGRRRVALSITTAGSSAGLLQPALADSRPPLHPDRRAGRRRLLSRAHRPRARRARPPRPAVGADQRLSPGQQRGGRPARAGGRRLRRRRGRADHDAGHLRPGATRSSTRSRPSSAARRSSRSRPPPTRSWRGSPPARAWRAASRARSVTVVEDGIALEVEPLSGQKTGMFIDQRETRARVGALAKGARVLDLLRLRRRLLAGRRARRRQGGHRRRQLGRAPSPARWRTPPRTASRSRRSRPTPFATSRPPRHAPSICWSSTRPSSRARARIWRPRARATSA